MVSMQLTQRAEQISMRASTGESGMLKNNPMVKKLMETGEERIGKVAQQLLSNERFVTAIQGLVSKTLEAKGSFDKSLRGALSAMNLPSTADVALLRTK